jgi:ABC-2 type transport system ATP-binding protein
MPQSATFPAGMTALEVVAHIGWMRGLSHRQARLQSHEALEMVDLSSRASTCMKQLSGGMARRVALAQALVSGPDVILLDEPSTGLDPEQRRIMIRLVQRLDATVLFSSHVLEDVEDVADRVLVLDDGRLLFDDVMTALAHAGEAGPGADIVTAADIESGFLSLVTRSRSGAR